MSGRAALLLVWVLFASGVCSHAQAFRLPANFNTPAAIGGSAGRYFTGSPTDRYTCKVCHAGAPAPQLHVAGLPTAGYAPGQTYSILIDWDDTLPSVAFNLEMTDRAGHALGTFSVPPPETLAPAELCGEKAGVVIAAGSERTLAIMTECGAHQSTIRWTAPAATLDASGNVSVPEAWFSGSFLAADKDGSILGDGISDLSHVLGPAGQAPPAATQINAGCNVSVPALQSGYGIPDMLSLFAAALWLRRGRRAVS